MNNGGKFLSEEARAEAIREEREKRAAKKAARRRMKMAGWFWLIAGNSAMLYMICHELINARIGMVGLIAISVAFGRMTK